MHRAFAMTRLTMLFRPEEEGTTGVSETDSPLAQHSMTYFICHRMHAIKRAKGKEHVQRKTIHTDRHDRNNVGYTGLDRSRELGNGLLEGTRSIDARLG